MSAEEDQKPAADVKPPTESTHIILKVLRPMRKLMKAFSEQKGRPLGSLIFTFDGVRIGGDSTPVDLEMEDGDTIEVFQIL